MTRSRAGRCDEGVRGGEQAIAGQTFVAIAPDGQDPCELRQHQGERPCATWSRSGSPMFEFAIKTLLRNHDLDTAEGEWPRCANRSGRRADQGRRAARRVRPPTRRLGRLGGRLAGVAASA